MAKKTTSTVVAKTTRVSSRRRAAMTSNKLRRSARAKAQRHARDWGDDYGILPSD